MLLTICLAATLWGQSLALPQFYPHPNDLLPLPPSRQTSDNALNTFQFLAGIVESEPDDEEHAVTSEFLRVNLCIPVDC